MIRPVTLDDAKRIAEIYNHYILNTTVTFEEQPLGVEEVGARIAKVTASYPWLVSEDGGHISGYAYATAWKERAAYRYTVESSIYLAPEQTGSGVGSALYATLIAELRARHMHCIIGGIAVPNERSVKFHQKFGFEKVGEFKQLGWKFDRWIDFELWQLCL